MKRLFILILLLIAVSCSTTKSIPVQTIEKIEYRDSLIYIKDTITIPIEKEVIKEVIPSIDTSYLETSVAKSVAYLDTAKRQLHHTLTQEGEVKTIIDTTHIITYVDRIVEKEVPVEVEVEKPYIPTFFWIVTIYAAIITILIAFKTYLKLKK